MTVPVRLMNGGNIHHVGIIPTFLNENDPKTAAQQFNDNYVFGGWSPSGADKWSLDDDMSLNYSGDDTLIPRAMMHLHDENIYVYDYALVCIVQLDGSFEVSRMD